MALTTIGITATAVSSGTANGTVIYSSTGNNAITGLMACNNSGSDITLTLYAVPTGKTAYVNPECTFVSNLLVPAGDTVSFDQEKFVLGNGDKLCGIASTGYTGTGVSVVLSTLAV
jgi:hypothetical protein